MKTLLTPTQKAIIKAIPNIPNFPIKGIQFKDVTPILAQPKTLHVLINELAKKIKKYKFDYIVAPESRGFFFAIPLAYKLGVPFVPIRKKGKLPRATISVTETIEYSKVSLEIHKQDIKPHVRVLLIDDLIATGGTIKAMLKLLKLLKAKPVAALFVVELPELNGRKELISYNIPVETIVKLPGA
ncbi:MAG: adenine phosphoribosyltransferase [Mycoplasmataceae bacterium]|jgi:adenine phosphoribosyltransferase|nr:adenine phosphoribosyltransferase [Mycoplasmataceae bacterium]